MMQSINKSHTKTEHMMRKTGDDVAGKARAARPLVLKILRFYNDFKNEHVYTQYLQATYDTSKVMLVDIDAEIQRLEEASLLAPVNQNKLNYLKKTKKNLKKIRKLCQDSSIQYYGMLPDNMPIDVRTYCVKFISQATI